MKGHRLHASKLRERPTEWDFKDQDVADRWVLKDSTSMYTSYTNREPFATFIFRVLSSWRLGWRMPLPHPQCPTTQISVGPACPNVHQPYLAWPAPREEANHLRSVDQTLSRSVKSIWSLIPSTFSTNFVVLCWPLQTANSRRLDENTKKEHRRQKAGTPRHKEGCVQPKSMRTRLLCL